LIPRTVPVCQEKWISHAKELKKRQWFFLVSPTCEGLSPCKCAPRAYERNKSKPGPTFACAAVAVFLSPECPTTQRRRTLLPIYTLAIAYIRKASRRRERKKKEGAARLPLSRMERRDQGGSSWRAYAAGYCSCIQARNHAPLLCKAR
jgi:hypothetical protein